MTGNIKWLWAAALAAILFPAAAQAQYPLGGYGYGGWGQANYGQGVYRGTGFVPPYFALHPPVYYSHEIIRRPMGASPFAYPSWYARHAHHAAAVAAAPAPQPLLVENPYVKARREANVSVEAATELTNPYVAGE